MADVQIVLEAQDKASVVLEQVAKKVEENVKQIRSTGEATKKSTELVGTFANALGDTGLGSFAGQLGGIIEKASAFSETMKDGAANSVAFKGGMIGLAAVIGFSVGNALGNVIFRTQELKDELEALGETSRTLSNDLRTVADRRFALIQEEIKLFADPRDQEQAALDALAKVEAEIAGTRDRIAQDFDESAQGLDPWFGSAADRAEVKRQFEENKEELKGNLESLKRQAETLRDQTSERRKAIEAAKEANAEQAKSNSFIANLRAEVDLLKAKKENINEITAANNTADAARAKQAEALLNERDQLKAEQERLSELDKITAELQKQLDIETLGADAAKEKEQLAIAANKAERDRIQALQDQINKQKQLNEDKKQAEKDAEEASKKRIEDAKKLAEEEAARKQKIDEFQPGVQAVESRLLTRGPAERGIDKIAKATEDSVKKLEDVEKAIRETAGSNSQQLEFVP